LTIKAKAKAKDSRFVLEDSSRPRTKAKDNNTVMKFLERIKEQLTKCPTMSVPPGEWLLQARLQHDKQKAVFDDVNVPSWSRCSPPY